jgi:AbiV family abortive infection protein
MMLTPVLARELWKALVDNATGLTEDAAVLLEAGSSARARSFLVLAQEELGKALWIYETFETAWNKGTSEPLLVERLRTHGRSHSRKYLESFLFGHELEMFWGDYSKLILPSDSETIDEIVARRRIDAERAAKDANIAKQAGFYVDVDEQGSVHSPRNVGDDSMDEDLRRATAVIEMLLIRDHSRMKYEATTPYDSTHEQQFRLLPMAHPEDFAEAMGEEGGPGHEGSSPAASGTPTDPATM